MYGPEAGQAVAALPALVDVMKKGSDLTGGALNGDDTDPLRVYAGEALARIGPAALPVLEELLTHEIADVCRRAADVRGKRAIGLNLGQAGRQWRPDGWRSCLVRSLQLDQPPKENRCAC